MQFSDVLDLILTVEPYVKDIEHDSRLTAIAMEVQETFGKGFPEILDRFRIRITKGSTLKWLIKNRVMKSDEISRLTMEYLDRKSQALPVNNFQSTPKYREISECIRKVTFNTDFFDRDMFERRDGRAFHFNSGKLGKFIQCEFENHVRICRVRLI